MSSNQSVIIFAIKQLGFRLRGRLVIRVCWTLVWLQTELNSVLLPLFINIIYILALFDFRDPFLKSPYFLGLKTCFMFVVFQFKIKVSIILKMIQRNYQLTKQNWLVCETVILFNWFWFQNLPAFNLQSKQMAKYFLGKKLEYGAPTLHKIFRIHLLSNPENRDHLKFFRNVDHCIKFRTHDQTSKPLTNERFCLRFNYLKPYWLVSHNTITFYKYFWCSQFCEFHCKPTYPRGTSKWPLHGGWPLNRISS